MFKSKKSDESLYTNNVTISNFNDTYNGAPKVTSTPLHMNSLSPRRNSVVLSSSRAYLGTPRRYSLSEVSASSSRSGLEDRSKFQGPLLASLNYKDNVSMYEETKSSGLAERIVSYNKEAEKDLEPTHQEKYNSPGLFPIVHLFRKKTPVLEQSLNRVKIKLSNSDYLKYSPVQNRTVEGTRLGFQHHLSSYSRSNSSEVGTKSVLDALKEISRKRIHSNEDIDINEDSGKRIRTELPNGTTPHTKRGRDISPLLDSSQETSPKKAQKKICVYDEYAASKSSTDFSFLKKVEPTLAKRKTISTSTESLKEAKQIKLINVETQTVATVEEDKTKKTDKSEDTDGKVSKKTDNSVKIFNDVPLDKIRKNRLAALMGNLAGKEATINVNLDKINDQEKAEDKDIVLKQTKTSDKLDITISTSEPQKISTDTVDKPVSSIITSPKAIKDPSPVKSDKHVHFNLASSTPSSDVRQAQLTQAFTTVAPIISSFNNTTSSNPNPDKNVLFGSATTLINAAGASSAPKYSFGAPNPVVSNSASSFSASVKQSDNSAPVLIDNSKPSDNFLTNTLVKPSVSPGKVGGFKFDLKMPNSSVVTTSTSTISSDSSGKIFSKPLANVASSSVVPISTTGVMFSFGKSEVKDTVVPSTQPQSTSTFTFGKLSEEKGNLVTPKISFPTEAKSDNAASSVSSGSNVTLSFGKLVGGKNPGGFNFGSTLPPSSVVNSSEPSFNFQVAKSPAFNFGSTPKALDIPKSTVPVSTAPTSSSFIFGSVAGNNKLGSGSSTISTVPPSNVPALTFGSTTTMTSSGFGSGSTSTTISLPPKPVFQISGGTAFSKSVGQTAPTNTSTTTASFAFGGGVTTQSTASTSKPFGFVNTTPSTPSIFGSVQTSTASKPNKPENAALVFGAAGVGFKSGATSTGPSFGSGQTTSAALFGNAPVTTASMFSSATSTSAPVFGMAPASSSAPVFGSTGSGFGSTAVTSAPSFGTDTKTAFGSDTKTAFGSGNMFGNAGGGPSFGSGTAPTFGSSNLVKPMFGGSSAPSNAVVPAFGAGGNPAFGVAASSPSSAFNATTTTASFGFGSTPSFSYGNATENKANVVFGSGADNSAFGKPTTTHNGFGTTDNGFGASTGGFGNNSSGFGGTSATFGAENNAFSTQAPLQQNSGFNFSAPSSSGPFMSGDVPKPAFNFTGASNPSFGSNNNPPAFGASASSFNAPMPTFGATGTPTAGVFNIGSGSAPSNRPRAQVRVKRRT